MKRFKITYIRTGQVRYLGPFDVLVERNYAEQFSADDAQRKMTDLLATDKYPVASFAIEIEPV